MFDWSNRVIGILDAEYSASNGFDAQRATDMAQRALAVRPQPDPGRMPDPLRDRHGRPVRVRPRAGASTAGATRRRHHARCMRQVDDEGAGSRSRSSRTSSGCSAVAGNETVRNAPARRHVRPAQNPDQLTAAARRPLPAPTARWRRCCAGGRPVMHFRRTATADTVVGGVHGRARATRWSSSSPRPTATRRSSPSRDGSTSGGAPTRTSPSATARTSASRAHLARLQMRAMFGAVLDRLPRLELAGEPVRLRSNFQNGIKHLPISGNCHDRRGSQPPEGSGSRPGSALPGLLRSRVRPGLGDPRSSSSGPWSSRLHALR